MSCGWLFLLSGPHRRSTPSPILYPQKKIERAHLSVGPIAVRSVGFDFASEDWDEVVAEVSIYVNELIKAYKQIYVN